MTFDEYIAYDKSRKRPAEEPEEVEVEVPKIHDITMNEEDRDFEEPQRPIDPPLEKNPHKKKPASVRELIQGAERLLEQGPVATGKVVTSGQGSQRRTVPEWPRRESSTTALKAVVKTEGLSYPHKGKGATG